MPSWHFNKISTLGNFTCLAGGAAAPVATAVLIAKQQRCGSADFTFGPALNERRQLSAERFSVRLRELSPRLVAETSHID
jgi:hypothetical protein